MAENSDPTTTIKSAESTFKVKAARRRLNKLNKYMAAMNDNGIIDFYGNKAEDERTTMAKNDASNVRCVSIDAAHSVSWRAAPSILQRGKNTGYAPSTAVCHFINKSNTTADR